MGIFAAVLLCLVASADVFVLAMSYGLQNTRIQPKFNLLISAVSGIGTFLAMLFAKLLCRYMSIDLANYAGGSILLLLGIKMMYARAKKLSARRLQTLVVKRAELSFLSVTVLALALTFNNLLLGFSASFAELDIVLVTGVSTILSIVFLEAGLWAGARLSFTKISNYADLVSALLILMLGIYTIFG